MTSYRFFNGRIFDGEAWHEEFFFQAADGKILSLEPGADPAPVDLQGATLAPALIDLQLYGGNRLFFGEHPSQASLEALVAGARAGGALWVMPTVATHSEEVMAAAAEAVRDYQAAGGKGVLGLHLEGPFIHPAKKGAHLEQYIQEPSLENLRRIIALGRGVVRMMTIAPELFESSGLRLLQEAGILLSAGHSNASYEQATRAFNAGVPLATHLYNAMSPLQHRAPGMVGAVLDHGKVMASIIADGYHVDAAAIRIAKKIMGERLFLITDAVTENREGYYRHMLRGDRFILPDGTLSGSALSMAKAVRFCVQQVHIPEGEALRMASLYPARAAGIDQEYGRIRTGYSSECLLLDASGQPRLVLY